LEAGEIAYSSFSFGKIYGLIADFIKEKNLGDYVSLAVPKMVIEELKNQKQRSYQKDIQDLKKISQRLTGLPHVADGEIKIPDENFSCAEFIETEANKFIATNNINLLDFQESDAPSMLYSMLAKVVGQENGKSPFARSGKFNDAGFKDSVIWETIMHFERVRDFDKVIFLTKDGDYKSNCIDDFKAKWQRHIDIFKDENLVIAELERDYGNYIENRKVYEYANKDYFKDYLFDLLKNASTIDYEGESLTIENFQVTNYCQAVDQVADEDGDYVRMKFVSDVAIDTTFGDEKIKISVVATTVLSDLDYMELEETIFEPNIN
jgi:hypothetical protein